MSICDSCYMPGACCQGFHLYGKDGGHELTFWVDGDRTVWAWLDDHGLPFFPHEEARYNDPETDQEYAAYRFSCPKLDTEGRCTIYEDRPTICRDLEPAGGSPLCIHSGGAEGTGDGL